MTIVWAEQALTSQGWQNNVAVTIGADGRIAKIVEGVTSQQKIGDAIKVGVLVPAPTNSHSHAFQRAMAGLTERRGSDPSDSFWTWRNLMYGFLDQITPEQVQSIAAFVQMEMLEAGFGASVEFHYLHHQANGQHYDNIAEMSERIAAAADVSGIGLTLLPVQYQYGGCDKRPLGAGQVRFGNDPDQFARLVSGARNALSGLPDDTNLGVAPHSLRAVAPEDLRLAPQLAEGGPVHIHIAEQIPEVVEVQSAWGARPVEWAIKNLPLDGRWCLIHATQMTPHETVELAKTGVVAGLCPVTEASLGDGIFDGVRWLDNGGKISIGSDSNILISLAEEMRVLDTSQRLRDKTRAALASETQSTGRRIFDKTCTGGAQAAGREAGQIAVGQWADLMALDYTHVDLAGLRQNTILDSFAFTGSNQMVTNVWSAGRHLVAGGHHIRRDAITAAYRGAVAQLRAGA
jgi:formimidoylglutamate deiminase